MKNKLRNHIIPALLFLCIFAFISCQDPVQPNIPKPESTKTIVRVFDNTGSNLPIADADVVFKSIYTGKVTTKRTGLDGTVELGEKVPINGEKYEIKVTVPQTGKFSQTPQNEREKNITALIPCSDTSFNFPFTPRELIPCNVTARYNIDINYCANKDTVLKISTPILSHNCPENLVLSIQISQQIASIPGLIITTTPNPLGTVAAGAEFQVNFTATRGDTILRSGTVTINGVGGGGNTITYIINVRFNRYECANCDCPQDFFTTLRPPSMVCVGNTSRFYVRTNMITNSNLKDCLYTFTLEKSFSNSDLDISPTSLSLAAGTTMRDSMIIVDFTPTKRGSVYDTAIYRIQKRDFNGVLTDCPSKLKVIIDSAYGGAGVCQIVTDPTNQGLITTDNRIQPCIGKLNTYKSLRIRNTGECNLRISASANSSRYFNLDSSTYTISPSTTRDIHVFYSPAFSDFTPNPVNGTLDITGCQQTSFPIQGILKFDCCFPVEATLHRWSETQGGKTLYQSVYLKFVGLESSLETSNDQAKSLTDPPTWTTGQRTFWFSNINAAARTAQLESDYATFALYTCGQPICDCRDNTNYSNNCGYGTSSIPVTEGTVIKFSLRFRIKNDPTNTIYEYCGILRVLLIQSDNETGDPKPIVTFKVVYP